MSAGQLDLERQSLQSTKNELKKNLSEPLDGEIKYDYFPLDDNVSTTNDCIEKTVPFTEQK